MVFNEPQIKNFIDFSKKIFRHTIKINYHKLYLIEYNSISNNKIKFSSAINKFLKSYVLDSSDIDFITLSENANNKINVVIYKKNFYQDALVKLGSIVASKVKAANWKLYSNLKGKDEYNFALGWGLHQYKFNNLKNFNKLRLSKNINYDELISFLSSIFYGKELINIPSSDMGPDAFEKSFINFSKYNNLKFKIYKDRIIKDKFPLIHAVGKASVQKPRLLELDYKKNSKYPLIILVGKGVCFDTGGLNLKSAQFMRNMKKDMGGAASVLSLANIILKSNININFKVLIPTVDNDVGSGSMRPGDVYNSRAGIKVEIGNTDAEGRLILADALTYADSFQPKLLIDFATLTGAARVALGPDLPAYFTESDELASIINLISIKEEDPLWRMPLWRGYDSWLKSDVADTSNISNGPFAGSVTAALFLSKFVIKTKNWIHIDTYAWSDKHVPGHSAGGDILGVRSMFKMIKEFIK